MSLCGLYDTVIHPVPILSNSQYQYYSATELWTCRCKWCQRITSSKGRKIKSAPETQELRAIALHALL